MVLFNNEKGGGANIRTLWRFDLSPIPAGAVINQVSAEFYVVSLTAANSLKLHSITQDWTEGNATWSTLNAAYDATTASTLSPTTSQAYSAAMLTSLVQQWLDGSTPNYGIMFRGAVNIDSQTTYASRESPNPPRLVVTYRRLAKASYVANKPLYLSEPGQGMDRIDPAATGDVTTAASALLDATPAGNAALDVRDQFNTAAFNSSDGVDPWSGGWLEGGENDGPTQGKIQVVSGSYCSASACLHMVGTGSNSVMTVTRQINLSGATLATSNTTIAARPSASARSTSRCPAMAAPVGQS